MEWAIFFAVAGALIALDLFGFERKAHEPGFRESILKTGLYVAVALAFGAWVWVSRGADAGLQYYTGYALELSLSFDNVFVISLILGALSIPVEHRARVLFLGIMGAIVLRGIFIGLGAAIVSQFHWVLLLFAAFLVFTGVKLLWEAITGDGEDEYDIEANRTLKVMRRMSIPLTKNLHGKRLFVKGVDDGKMYATPLFVAIVLVEVADLVFAVDSIPAIFAITTDPYIVFTSNIFAIVGLRSLFFVLQAMVHRFAYLGIALSVVLIFIGAKVLAHELLHFELSTIASLGIVLGILAAGIFGSLFAPAVDDKPEEAHKHE